MSMIRTMNGHSFDFGGMIGRAELRRFGPWIGIFWSEGAAWFRVIDGRLRFLLVSDARRADKMEIRRLIIAALKKV